MRGRRKCSIVKWRTTRWGFKRTKKQNPKLVEQIEAQDMVEYYAKKLKEANIHLKKLKQ